MIQDSYNKGKERKDGRLIQVDLLRGIAILLMLFAHSIIVYPVNLEKIEWCSNAIHFITTFDMELFFLLAGYVYHCKAYGTFITKKVKRILIPYLFFGAVALILRAYGGSAVNGNEPLLDGIKKLVFEGGGYWFLYTSFLIFLVYPWIEKLLHADAAKLVFMIVLMILNQFVKMPQIMIMWGNVIYYLPYFVFGQLIRAHQKESDGENNVWIRKAAGAGALVLFIVLDLVMVKNNIKRGPLKHVRAVAIMYVVYILIEILLPWLKKCRAGQILLNFLEDCSQYSLQLYLFNGYLLTIFRILICNVCHISSSVPIVFGIWIGNLVVTLVSCKWIIPRIPVLRELCGLGK